VAAPAELMSIETPPASTALNLLPQAWREERARQFQRGQWKRRLVIAGMVYATIVGLALIQLAYLKFRIWQLDAQIKRDDPRTVFVRAASNNWKALAPAVDPHFYPIEILQHLFDSLPSQDVRITAYNQSARQISIEGEANKAALAYEFAEKVKKHPDLQNFNFDMQSPRILPSGGKATMIAKILQRMNRRERILAGAVALVVFFLANLFVWSWLFRAAGDSRVEVVTRKQKHAEQTVLLRETDLWTNRDKWLREHQPAFHGASDASALLDQLKQVASKYSVLIENPAIGPSAGTGNYQSVSVSIETKSQWPPLVHFLYDVQAPDGFMVFESANIASDPTQMRGKFKIARWYAPATAVK
jgi:hypothetical protein